ncbi:spermidine synthase [Neptunitalea chrysea]|uniref:Spermidine synthase n=1 Tax=Neptunitalea chrysea TaxID=1647581 RepID=A0A9W6ETX6_9FLAO|nr:fused MFS/spermidine synthase [Neptunitalea chrysea]GLB51844.1 spermidine synthase [Neptunitalea chrysea]
MKKNLFIRILSFIFPVTTNKYQSNFSGTIEITLFNGKKMVDTENANYSYGSLQKILKFGLHKIPLDKIESILILGLGAGSVIETLQKLNYNNTITAVEIDPLMITIAKEEFGIANSDTTTIIKADAFEFLKQHQHSFDLIIIDLFIDTEVPNLVYESEFLVNLKNSINTNGWFIFNAALTDNNEKQTQTLETFFNASFNLQTFKKVRNTNTLLIGQKNG